MIVGLSRDLSTKTVDNFLEMRGNVVFCLAWEMVARFCPPGWLSIKTHGRACCKLDYPKLLKMMRKIGLIVMIRPDFARPGRKRLTLHTAQRPSASKTG